MRFIDWIKSLFRRIEDRTIDDSAIETVFKTVSADDYPIPPAIYDRFKKKSINGAYKECIREGLSFEEYEPYISYLLHRMYKKEQYGEILSFMYEQKNNYGWHPVILLKGLYRKHDHDAFIKQVYRFRLYPRFKVEVDAILDEWIAKGKQDAYAWREKYNDIESGIKQ